jgi:pimeloyl-ACP methyl ester carboxylesterase
MSVAAANGIEIFFDDFGSRTDDAVLLVRGFGSQMISWHEEFCEQIAAHGFHVIRFDNRDVGLSSKFDEAPPYTLDDMATDAVGLLDHLGIDAAHVTGMSMGGMIAQLMAINHPGRVRSLASIMSHMSDEDTVQPTTEAAMAFMKPPATARDEAIANDVDTRRVVGSPGFPFDEAEVYEMAARSYDRCYCPLGRVRQAIAVRAATSRKAALSKLVIPVTVIHGADDPLIPAENGRRTAAAIPGAELVIIDGMGHDIPRGAWDRVVGAIVANARRAS